MKGLLHAQDLLFEARIARGTKCRCDIGPTLLGDPAMFAHL